MKKCKIHHNEVRGNTLTSFGRDVNFIPSFGRDVKLGVPCLDAACIVGLIS